jgi:hypothetical protein
MARTFAIDGRMKVDTLQEKFKELFGVAIRVYHGKKFANGEETVSSIKTEGSKGGKFEINGRTLVKNVEKEFMEKYGLRVQIEDKSGGLADNALSLTKVGQ